MPKRTGLILLALLAAAFLIMNRGAYRGFFESDDLSTLGFTPGISALDYVKITLSPLYQTNNFRPVGNLFYRASERFFGLDFPGWVAVIHSIHLFNVWILWLLMRRLGAKPWPAAAACIFFGFHMALFEAVWKPMYVYDLLCGTFCLLSLLAYAHQRWILSFLAFWVAYKSKEIAVMLPAALAAYEYWLGKQRWIRLAPFAAVALSFGIQGLLRNPNAAQNNDYTFRFTPAALTKTSVFYSGRVFLIPYLGFAIPLAALIKPDSSCSRRTWFGLAGMIAFFLPLLFLPGRLSGAYCYVPFTGLAIAFSGAAEAAHPAGAAIFLLLFLPLDFRQLRTDRRAALAASDEVRPWLTSLATFARSSPYWNAVLYDGAPSSLDHFGIQGALQYLFAGREFSIAAIEEPEATQLRQQERIAVLNWDRLHRNLAIVTRTPETPDAAYFEVGPRMPLWQLEEGWYNREDAYCWIAPDAAARLYRPENAHRFDLRVNIGPELLQAVGGVSVRVALDGEPLAPRRFTSAGWQRAQWDLPPAKAGVVHVAFHVQPGYRPQGSRPLGIAIGGFGFVSETQQ